jgi:phage baseplate assembly protein W
MARLIVTEKTLNPVYSDIDMGFEKQSDGDFTKDVDIEAIKNSLINIITTIPGERRMLPNFGLHVYNLLFEPMSKETANKLGGGIIDAIKLWEDRIIIDTVNISVDYDNHRYDVNVDFTIKGMGGRANIYSVDVILKAQ